MRTVKRYDFGTLGKAERTPQGGIRVPARFTRVGIFEYQTEDGETRRELRPPDEVFNPESMETLRDAPITNLHVSEITPENFSRYVKGHVGSAIKQDGIYLAGDAVIQDAEIIRMVERGERKEFSLGYDCVLDETPGEWEGERYDAIQRNIKYNHAALGPEGWGRAGKDVALRLDSRGDVIASWGDTQSQKASAPQTRQREDSAMSEQRVKRIEVIGGDEYEVGSNAHAAAVKRRDGEVEDLKKIIEKLEEDLEEAKARADEEKDRADEEKKKLDEEKKSLEERLDELEKKFDEMVEERAKERADLLQTAKDEGVDIREDASDHEIRCKLLEQLTPGVRFDSKDAAKDGERARIALELKLEERRAAREKSGVASVAHGTMAGRFDSARGEESPAAKARREAMERLQNAWKS